MEEQRERNTPDLEGSKSPFMAFEDVYEPEKRPASSVEEFWEQRRLSSSESETKTESRKSDLKSPRSLKAPSFMTNTKISFPRLSNLSSSRPAKLSSLRLSDLGEHDLAEGSTRESRVRTLSRRLIPSFSFGGSTPYRTASPSLDRS